MKRSVKLWQGEKYSDGLSTGIIIPFGSVFFSINCTEFKEFIGFDDVISGVLFSVH